MLVRVHFATCVFTLHAPVHSSCAQPPSQPPRLQPHSQWISCLQPLKQSLLVPCFWPQSLLLTLLQHRHPWHLAGQRVCVKPC